MKHTEILDVVQGVRIREDELRKEFKARRVDREDLLGFTYRTGDKVLDSETGMEGEVIYVTRKRVTKVQGS